MRFDSALHHLHPSDLTLDQPYCQIHCYLLPFQTFNGFLQFHGSQNLPQVLNTHYFSLDVNNDTASAYPPALALNQRPCNTMVKKSLNTISEYINKVIFGCQMSCLFMNFSRSLKTSSVCSRGTFACLLRIGIA